MGVFIILRGVHDSVVWTSDGVLIFKFMVYRLVCVLFKPKIKQNKFTDIKIGTFEIQISCSFFTYTLVFLYFYWQFTGISQYLVDDSRLSSSEIGILLKITWYPTNNWGTAVETLFWLANPTNHGTVDLCEQNNLLLSLNIYSRFLLFWLRLLKIKLHRKISKQ